MDKTCGTCGKCRNTHDGPYCYKGSSPRPVSPLRVMDCWVDPAEVEQAPVMTKVCSVCGRELPVSEFGRHSRTKDGYQPFCRQCHSEMNKGHRKRQAFENNEAPAKPEEVKKIVEESKPAKPSKPRKEGKPRGRKVAHPDTVVDGVKMHWCGCCKQYKPVEEFSKDSSNKSGLATQCKACRVVLEHERRVRKREAKKAFPTFQPAPALQDGDRVKLPDGEVREVVEIPPTPGGLLDTEIRRSQPPKVVVKRELKVTKSVSIEAYLTEIGRDEDGRKGHFYFNCMASELDKLMLVWNKNPLTVTLSFDEIVEG